MCDTIVKDLCDAKERGASIEEIDHIINTSLDYYGKTGRYDVAKCVYEDQPEMWKEIKKLSIKKSVDIQMKCYDIAKDLIASNFHCFNDQVNSVYTPSEYRFDVYGFIADYIGKDKFDIIMAELPDFLRRD